MNEEKIGALIRALRLERAMTQRELGEKLHVCPKTVSKWERGRGCPELSLLPLLAGILGIPAEQLLSGELPAREKGGSLMKDLTFYVCPVCGNILQSARPAETACCGRKLEALKAKKAEEGEKLHAERVEDEWYIESDHPMTKEHSIAFAAFVTSERAILIPQYPEWSLSFRLPMRAHGKLFWYCTQHGLFYQLL